MILKSSYKIAIPVCLALTLLLLLQESDAKGAAPKKKGTVEEWADFINKRAPELMSDLEVPGLVMALIKNGETVLTHSFGYADLSTNAPMTEETICRVESISKSVTAWGVMNLVDKGLVELDKPLNHYLKSWNLPESDFPENEITIRRLLNQTSGMPLGTIGVRYTPRSALPPFRENLKKDAVLFQNPGLSFYYSNTGYNILEILIEEVTGREFAEYMSTEILKPLGMKDSSYVWSDQWNPGVPTGYDSNGLEIPVYVYPDKASGGLFSTAGDIASFIIAGMEGTSSEGRAVLSANSLRDLYSESANLKGYYSLIFDSYGFGHFIERLPGGLYAISSGGQGSGWMSQFYFIPEKGDGIVMISNSQRSWPLFSEILVAWSQWNGHPVVGMGLIREVSLYIRIFLIGLSVTVTLGFLWIIILMIRGHRHISLNIRNLRKAQMLKLLLSFTLIGVILYVNSMKYFFLDSVFPGEMPDLKSLMIYSALLLFLSVFTPERKTV